MPRLHVPRSAAVAVLALVVGCGDRPKDFPVGIGDPCAVDDDCAPDQICVDSPIFTSEDSLPPMCELACASDDDCPRTGCGCNAERGYCQVGCK